MNKNIIIGILAIVSVLSLSLDYIQSIAAEKARIEAERNSVLSMQAQKEASRAQQMADSNAMEANVQRQRCEELMKNCKEKK